MKWAMDRSQKALVVGMACFGLILVLESYFAQRELFENCGAALLLLGLTYLYAKYGIPSLQSLDAWIRAKRGQAAAEGGSSPPWGFTDAVSFFLFWELTAEVVGGLGGLLAQFCLIPEMNSLKDIKSIYLGPVFQLICPVFWLWLRRPGDIREILSFRLPEPSLGACLLAFALCYQAALMTLFFSFHHLLRIENPYLDEIPTSRFPLGEVFSTVVGPFAEEVLFRGFMISALAASFGLLPAALMVAVYFGSGHVSCGEVECFLNGVRTGASSLVYTFLLVKGRSIYLPAGAHMFNNSEALPWLFRMLGVGR